MTNLITKYRPQVFDDVIGQDAVVRSLKTVCKKKDSQAFLLSGPSGVGKTTLARIIAYEYGVEDKSVMEIDAASRTGIDDMRQLQEVLLYRPFGDSGRRAVILDECHALSKNAFDSLLKALEDPPKHVVWFFCTTNPVKIPKTLQTRCTKFELKSVTDKDLKELLLDWICEQEKITLPDGVGDLLVKEANGSPRQLLSNIVVARTARNKKEAADLLKTVVESDASLAFCQYIVNGNGSWTTCMNLLGKIDGNPESVRILVVNYLATCLKNAKSNDQAGVFLEKLDAFSQSYVGTDGPAPLMMSIGRSLFKD